MIQFYYPCGITEEEYNKWWENEMRDLEYWFWYGEFKKDNMKQKLILHDNSVDRDMYFDSYEEMAKHLDTSKEKLMKVCNTGKIINYIYTISTK